MKITTTRLMIAFAIFFSFNSIFAQNPSMSIQHTGLSPNDTLWVMAGDSIDFIYGGGGNHPMASGQGSTVSPVFFPTITVTSGSPLARFALTTVGTYIFHCSTNPGNTANWGTIIVQSTIGIKENLMSKINISVFPNPSSNFITVKAPNIKGTKYSIIDVSGRLILQGILNSDSDTINISELKAGAYFINVMVDDILVPQSFFKD